MNLEVHGLSYAQEMKSFDGLKVVAWLSSS